MRGRRFLMAVALLMALFAIPQGQALPLPEWKFRVMISAHFELIYNVDQKSLAKRYLLAAEQAYELLIPIFKEAPERTIVFLSDDTDLTNGGAGFLPYPMITVYPVLSSTLEAIDDAGDWPLELMIHEYTHILNMYPVHGFYVPLKWVFGDLVRPNAILPTWYLEGLAVNMESRLTDHGRLRADETQGSARALVLDHKWQEENIARINEQDFSTWPYGSRPYLYGGWWWREVQNEKGADVIHTWNQNFARRLPFFVNGPVDEQTHRSADEQFMSSMTKVEAQAKAEIEILRASHPTVGQAVVDETGEQTVFAVSPGGRHLVYLISHPNRPFRPESGTEVRIKTRSAANENFAALPGQRLFKAVGTTRISWLDDHRFVLDQIDLTTPYVNYRDLYLYTLGESGPTRLTHRLRAQEPAVSPSGQQIAFIKNDGGRNHVAVINWQKPNEPPQILVTGTFNDRLSSPEYLNDRELLYIKLNRMGEESIFVYSFDSHLSQPWNSTLKRAQHLRRTSQGILVSDSGTHARNVYLANAGDHPSPALTNTLTHIETSDYDPLLNQVIYCELTGSGRRLREIPFAPQSPPRLTAVDLPPPPKVNTTSIPIHDEDYSPISYLAPHFWLPFVYLVENNALLFQGLTSNNDPTGRNSYNAFGSIDTITHKPSYGISYTNDSLPTEINLGYSHLITFLGASSYNWVSDSGDLLFTNYWPFANRDLRWTVGGLWNQTQTTVSYNRLGPEIGIQYSHLQNPLNTWHGFQAEAWQQQYFHEGNDLGYGRTYVHWSDLFQLGGGNKVFFQGRAAFAPQLPILDVLALGDRNVGGNYVVNLANSDFLLRGYPSGTFIGRKILNANLEYAFPLIELSGGYGTLPLFLRNLEVAAFYDTMAVDGGGFRPDYNEYLISTLSHFYSGTGVELRLATTAAYHLPISFVLGGYYGLNTRYEGGFTTFVGLGMGDLSALGL